MWACSSKEDSSKSSIDREHSDPVADKVVYPQLTMWLNPDELTDLINEVRDAIRARVNNAPSSDRRPHLFSAVLFPTELPPETS
jgi:hypothetical protein